MNIYERFVRLCVCLTDVQDIKHTQKRGGEEGKRTAKGKLRRYECDVFIQKLENIYFFTNIMNHLYIFY